MQYDDLITFTTKVEATLNQRAILFVSNENNGPQSLRPIDFIHLISR